MSVIKNYKSFGGRHWESGSVHNVLDFQGVIAPHTGKAFSEEFLLGVSGGITVGYFLFHYEGYQPQFVLLTRNTFDPLQTLLERMGIAQNILQSTSAAKGKANLLSVLEEGLPAIVWADSMALPYNAMASVKDYWAMQPIVVFGHDGERVHIADRSKKPLTVNADIFEEAQGRVKKMKHRVISLEKPIEEKIVSAATSGIWQCISLFLEAPPRGTKNNFGLQALQNWAKMLTNTRNAKSWTRYFPAKEGMFSALAGNIPFPGMYEWIAAWGDNGAERYRYANFLDEAAILLNKPELSQAGTMFQESGDAWKRLGMLALPNEISLLHQARQLLDKRHNLFTENGSDAEESLRAINSQLKELLNESKQNNPITEDEAMALRSTMSNQIVKIHDIEENAIHALQTAMT
jgi:ElaB/YqjD/DUF883 family membrane-anchored ribosome-binding protein